MIAERWTPLILREIVLFDRHHFSEIQHGVGRISQSLLSARLRTLEAAGVLERRPNPHGRGWEYHPTWAGRELETVLNELGIWAQHWIELRQEDCDPAYLMQTVHSMLRLDRLPHSPTTVRFEFTVQPKIYWLILEGDHPELWPSHVLRLGSLPQYPPLPPGTVQAAMSAGMTRRSRPTTCGRPAMAASKRLMRLLPFVRPTLSNTP